jgi:hypothetical protein
MKNEKKKLEFIKNPDELTSSDLINIKGGYKNKLADCKCVCKTNNEAKCGNNETQEEVSIQAC